MGQTKPLMNKKVFDTALLYERMHPAGFYEAAINAYDRGDKYGGAFLYYLGQLRYKYYCHANPEVEEDGDKAVLASLNSVVGEEINFFLGGHADNYAIVLDSVLAWDKRHEYTFYPKKKSPAKHKEILDGLTKLRNYIVANKASIEEQNAAARKERH
ncbi:hypothetical protein GCM10023093_24300 [Nemorincola caseinilytica]|uniref:Uncharacterized protein n=2 Tax=Nemorincola caseinilytica TaxID=2054315 RepID=A0ABP8NLG5_9BACT